MIRAGDLRVRWAIGATALLPGAARALAGGDDGARWPSGELGLRSMQPAGGVSPETGEPAPAQPGDAELARRVFGEAGTMWWSAGGGACWNFVDATDVMADVGWSLFLADELEFRLELGGWYFNQPGDNTGAISAVGLFHWHMFHDERFTWTLFGEVGIGLLAGFDNVPAGGTGVDFAPRIGGGYTQLLGDTGVRLEVGLRWRHLSNGRYEGDVRNPARDSMMFFAGVIFPF